MAIRKSPYKVNQNGIDEAFLLPERDEIENEKKPTPQVKVRRAHREDEPDRGGERPLQHGLLSTLLDGQSGSSSSRRGDTEILADHLLFGGPDVDDDELADYVPDRRTVSFGSGMEASQRGFAMDAREKKRRKTAKTVAEARPADTQGKSGAGRDDKKQVDKKTADRKTAAKSGKESPMRPGSLLGEPTAKSSARKDAPRKETPRTQAAAVSPAAPAMPAFKARRWDGDGTPRDGRYVFPPKKLKGELEPGTLAFPSRFTRRGLLNSEEDGAYGQDAGQHEGVALAEGGLGAYGLVGLDGFGQDAATAGDHEDVGSDYHDDRDDSRGGMDDMDSLADMDADGSGDAEDVEAEDEFLDEADGADAGKRDVQAMSREERSSALRAARQSLFFPRPGDARAAGRPTARTTAQDSAGKGPEPGDQARELPGVLFESRAAEPASGMERYSRAPDLARLARLEEEEDARRSEEKHADEFEDQFEDVLEDVLEEVLEDQFEGAPEDELEGEVENGPADGLEEEASEEPAVEDADLDTEGEVDEAVSFGATEDESPTLAAKAAGRTAAAAKKPKGTRRTRAKAGDGADAAEKRAASAEVSNLLDLKVEANPYGLGPGTTPAPRVHFARFLTWSTLSRHVVSLRDEYGHFAAPGLLGALEDNRQAAPVLNILREAAKKRGWPFYAHRIFVPVVYPEQADYRLWKQAANAGEQNMVFLHYWLKCAPSDEVLSHFGISLPKTRRQRNVTRCLWENREGFTAFFEDPRHASCRGLVLRENTDLFFGKGTPLGSRPVNYCILRPEWVVDIRPVGESEYLLSKVRKSPRGYLERIQRLLVTTPDELSAAKRGEDRSARRIGEEAQSSVYSGVNDGLELVLSAHKPYGRRTAAPIG